MSEDAEQQSVVVSGGRKSIKEVTATTACHGLAQAQDVHGRRLRYFGYHGCAKGAVWGSPRNGQ